MPRIVALIDGEHYPPVVRSALAELAAQGEVVGAVFLGGTEKVDLSRGLESYGVPVHAATTATTALAEAMSRWAPDEVVDLSDEPVLSSADRFALASVALAAGVVYRGADFMFAPPRAKVVTETPCLGLIGTGKRVGKTAVSAFVARRLASIGTDVVVLAMGRGGPETPEVIHGDRVALTTEDLLALARKGVHASSDNYEDAIMSRVTTVGSRRCGGGMAGETFFGTVAEGARVADALGKELLIAEGSGAAIPPVYFDATILVVGAGRGVEYVRDYFGPYRVARADLVILASCEPPIASVEDVVALRAEIERQRPGLPVVATTFRPRPIEPVDGRRVFFATTAPAAVVPLLATHLELEYGCRVVGTSAHLSDRARLRDDMRACEGGFDLLLTELKAAAIDVAAAAAEEAGVATVLCDNVPVAVDGSELEPLVDEVAALARRRSETRKAAR